MNMFIAINRVSFKTMKRWASSLLIAIFLLTIAPIENVQAAVGIEETIPYQGRILLTGGTAVSNASYNMKFKIFDALTGGTELWSETWDNGTSRVATSNGLFSVQLGTHTSFSGVDFNTDNLYLEVQFDPGNDDTYEETFSPRRQFGAVPYAHNADTVDGLEGSQFIRADSDDEATGKVTFSNADIGVNVAGTASGKFMHAQQKLTSSGDLVVDGSANIDGSVTLGDTTSDTVSYNARVSSDIDPSSDLVYSLGDPALRWKNIYAGTGVFTTVSGATVIATTLNAEGGTLNNVTVNGGTIDGATLQNVTINGDLEGATLSGLLVHASNTLRSSGGLIVEGNSDLQGNVTIGGTITTALSQGVAFINSAGELVTDGVRFFWDNVNHRLGIGTNAPETELEVVGTMSGTIVQASNQLNSSGTLTVEGVSTFNNTIQTVLNEGVAFVNSANQLVTDNTNFFWDSANNRLGIGTNAPTTKLEVAGTASGLTLQASNQLNSSGTLAVEGAVAMRSFTNCSALETDVNGNVVCGTDDTGGGGSSTLQEVYDNDADGGNATIALSSADDSVVFQNPASGGTDSDFLVQFDQDATNKIAVDIDSEATSSPGMRIDIVGTSAAPHILFGYDGTFDTNLYRSAANTLTTDDHFTPGANDNVDLGSTTNRWRDLYLGPDSLHIGENGSNEGIINYDSTADALEISFDGSSTPVLSIEDTGDIGIGMENPDAKLAISDSENQELIHLHDSTNSDSIGIYVGSGTPELNVFGQLGSLYLDHANGALYVKDTGDGTVTGWVEVGSGNGGITFAQVESAFVSQGGDTMTGALTMQLTTADPKGSIIVDQDTNGTGILIDSESTSHPLLVLDGADRNGDAPHIRFGYKGAFDVDMYRHDIGGLTIENEQTGTEDAFRIVTDNVSTNNTIFRVQNDGEVYADGSFNGSGADYAEWFYTNDTSLEWGETVCIDITRDNAVERCTNAADGNLMGIVSHPEQAAFIGNAISLDGIMPPNYALIGLIGQLATFTTNENGPIRPGDALTSSSTPGRAMRALPGDPTVGIALEGTDEANGRINVLISRRNSSVTVDTVEEHVLQTISSMEIEDEVQFLVQDAVSALTLEEEITAIVDKQLAKIDLATEIATALRSFEESLPFVDSTWSGDLDILGDLTSNHLIAQTMTIHGDVHIAGNVFVEGLLETADLSTSSFTASTIDISNTATVEDIVINGTMILNGETFDITALQSESENAMHVTELLIEDTLEVLGEVSFRELVTFFNDVHIEGDLHIQGTLSVGSNQAGFAELLPGRSSVTVLFETPFTNIPIIVATPTSPVLFGISEQTETSFTLSVEQSATEHIIFNWQALAVVDAIALPDTLNENVEETMETRPFYLKDGKPYSITDNMWNNHCISNEPLFDSEGKLINYCSRWRNGNTWEHPDYLTLSFVWNADANYLNLNTENEEYDYQIREILAEEDPFAEETDATEETEDSQITETNEDADAQEQSVIDTAEHNSLCDSGECNESIDDNTSELEEPISENNQTREEVTEEPEITETDEGFEESSEENNANSQKENITDTVEHDASCESEQCSEDESESVELEESISENDQTEEEATQEESEEVETEENSEVVEDAEEPVDSEESATEEVEVTEEETSEESTEEVVETEESSEAGDDQTEEEQPAQEESEEALD